MTKGSNQTADARPMEEPVVLVDRENERRWLKLYLTKGINCQIVGPPGIGKTAFLANVGRIAASLPGKFLVAYADLADPRCQTVQGLLKWISAACELNPPCDSLIDLGKLVRNWRQSGTRPVLCMDHFEELVRRDREFSQEFFVELRGLAQAGLTLITASREPLSAIIPWYSRTSPFFNVFEILSLGPLSPKAAEELLESLCSGKPMFTPQEKEALVRFANGNSLALRVAWAQVAKAKEKGESMQVALSRAEEDLRSQLPVGEPARS